MSEDGVQGQESSKFLRHITFYVRDKEYKQGNVSKIVGGPDLELGVVSLAGVVRVDTV